jgi:rare lipoprotein A
LASLFLANCASGKFAGKVDPKYGVAASPRVVAAGEPVPKGGGVYRVGRPYVIAGRSYVPQENGQYAREGLASWYGEDFHGRLTANGEVYDMESISAAHPTLPMPSYVRVTNLANRRSLIVRVNDRGPYHADREIDLSYRAAQLLGFHGRGVARVRVEYVGTASLEGSDDRRLMATLREGSPAPAPSLVRLASAQISRLPPNAPLPPERPFELGESGAVSRDLASVATEAISPTWVHRSLPRMGDNDRYPAYPSSRLTSAVTAYAPDNSVGPRAVTLGRGLY